MVSAADHRRLSRRKDREIAARAAGARRPAGRTRPRIARRAAHARSPCCSARRDAQDAPSAAPSAGRQPPSSSGRQRRARRSDPVDDCSYVGLRRISLSRIDDAHRGAAARLRADVRRTTPTCSTSGAVAASCCPRSRQPASAAAASTSTPRWSRPPATAGSTRHSADALDYRDAPSPDGSLGGAHRRRRSSNTSSRRT